ncbi:hypothetical protein CORC01_08253 [Colletotrichum orchidophilum]|uniref:Uncharacterized protein n=1 Tax=Colletotrichum orchidophilum TaxID=1209926 RepID=A0A1G4B4X0_9PEZI|nr:uncharacterized protein CORC01_08253 [Colletotrichum orchidophilum]OHE96490.1 hypothetical protein CORC01_08253 [Colletotrichum orchidophilum]
MKPSSFLCALGITQLSLAAPVPSTISDMVSVVRTEARRLTRVSRVSLHRTRPLTAVYDSETEFDNEPVSPSEDMPPSVVLAAPRPLTTVYLQSLSKHPASRGKDRVVDVVGDGTPEKITPMSLKDGLAEMLPTSLSQCWEHISRPMTRVFEQHPDLIVLGAVIALVLVLLVLEFIGTTFQGVRQHYDPQGVIRLEVDEKAFKTPSFRCDSVPIYDEEQGAEEPRP